MKKNLESCPSWPKEHDWKSCNRSKPVRGFESLALRQNEKQVARPAFCFGKTKRGIRTRREQTQSAEENSPVDCFCRRGQGEKRREGARECAEKTPCSPPKVHRNVDRIIVDFFHARKPLERQAHIRILSKSDRLRSVQRHRDLKLCGVVLFIANRKMIRKNFDL